MDPTSTSDNKDARDEQILTFDYAVYATSPHEFQTWIDKLISYFRKPVIVVALFIAIGVYLLGFLIAFSIDFNHNYVRTIPVYIGVFGIFWVVVFIRYASQGFHRAYEELRPCLLIPDDEYVAHIKYWFARLAELRGTVKVIIVCIVLAWILVYMAYSNSTLLERLNLTSMRSSPFHEENWFTPQHYLVKALLLAFFGVCVAIPLGTGIRMLAINFMFLLTLRKFPLLPLPNLLRTRLQRVTNIYLISTLSWFVGVALFGAVLFKDLDLISVIGLLGLSLLGILTFFTPQVIYRLMLVQSNHLSSQWVLAAFYNRFQVRINERRTPTLLPSSIGLTLANMDDLSGFVAASSDERLWVYNPGDIALLFIAQGLALLSVYAQDILSGLLR